MRLGLRRACYFVGWNQKLPSWSAIRRKTNSARNDEALSRCQLISGSISSFNIQPVVDYEWHSVMQSLSFRRHPCPISRILSRYHQEGVFQEGIQKRSIGSFAYYAAEPHDARVGAEHSEWDSTAHGGVLLAGNRGLTTFSSMVPTDVHSATPVSVLQQMLPFSVILRRGRFSEPLSPKKGRVNFRSVSPRLVPRFKHTPYRLEHSISIQGEDSSKLNFLFSALFVVMYALLHCISLFLKIFKGRKRQSAYLPFLSDDTT